MSFYGIDTRATSTGSYQPPPLSPQFSEWSSGLKLGDVVLVVLITIMLFSILQIGDIFDSLKSKDTDINQP